MGLVAVCAGLVVVGLLYLAAVLFGGIRPIPLPGICLAEAAGSAINVSGFDFEFEELDCDVIAKDSAMIVYVSRHGDKQRYALVKYAGNPPTVTSTGPKSVRINLGQIWGSYFRHDTWGDLHVDYDFERFAPPRQR
jgi:hypothetical protein